MKICALICVLASGQELTIRTQVPLVMSPVTVTDRNGRFVDGLAESDFELLDNGKPQKVQVDTSDVAQTPISLAIAVATHINAAAALGKIR